MSTLAQIRPATLNDAATMARLSAQLGYPASESLIRERLQRLISSLTHVVIVAEDHSSIAGWAAAEVRIALESDPRVEITGLIVDHQVRRSGVGRSLVGEIEKWALTKGCRLVFVKSNVARAESHPFYEILGYERTKTQHTYKKVLDAL